MFKVPTVIGFSRPLDGKIPGMGEATSRTSGVCDVAADRVEWERKEEEEEKGQKGGWALQLSKGEHLTAKGGEGGVDEEVRMESFLSVRKWWSDFDVSYFELFMVHLV